MRIFETPLFLKNEESFDNKMSDVRCRLASLRRRCLFLTCINGIPQKEFGIPQKQVYRIYVYFVNGIPQKEFGISQNEVHFIYV